MSDLFRAPIIGASVTGRKADSRRKSAIEGPRSPARQSRGQPSTMTALQAIILAIVQGVTELFPISSLGHAVILPALLGWKVDENSDSFLPFLVVMHLGTAV